MNTLVYNSIDWAALSSGHLSDTFAYRTESSHASCSGVRSAAANARTSMHVQFASMCQIVSHKAFHTFNKAFCCCVNAQTTDKGVK